MFPGRPFSILQPKREELAVSVSERYKGVWATPGVGMDSMGRIVDDSGMLGAAGPRMSSASWWYNLIEGNATPPVQSPWEYTRYWVPPSGPITPESSHGGTPQDGGRWITICTRKFWLRRKCLRIVLSQNCTVESRQNQLGNEERRIVFGTTPFWCRPTSWDGVTEEEAAVRPWTIGTGDIEGWKTPRKADFLPHLLYQPSSGMPRQSYANSIVYRWQHGDLESLPEAWGVPENVPIYRIEFKEPRPGWKDYRGLTPEQMEAYFEAAHAAVDNGEGIKIIYWGEGVGTHDDTLGQKLRHITDWSEHVTEAGEVPGMAWEIGVDVGDAFDLCVMFETVTEKEMVNEPSGNPGEIWDHWTVEGEEEVAWYVTAMARTVKALPPAPLEGGA